MSTVDQGSELPKEAALLEHVLRIAPKGDPEAVLGAIDQFGWDQWLMAIGDEQGAILDDAVASAQPIRHALELGTYCGYSALRIARRLPPGATLISVDPSDTPASVAAPILEHAGLKDRMEMVRAIAAEAVPALQLHGVQFDFVLIDHDKEQYLADLQRLEQAGLMRRGTVVAADNVIVFKPEDYQRHVRESGRYLSSVLHEAHVEYNKDKADGVEVSVYAG